MNPSKKTLNKENLAGVIFLLFFPGFFVYSYAVAEGYVSTVPGGWFGRLGVASALCLLPTAFPALFRSTSIGRKFHIFFLVLLLLIAAWASIYYLYGSTLYQRSPTAFVASLKIIVLWFVLFFVGYFFSPRRWFINLLWLSFFLMIIIVLTKFDTRRMMFYAIQQFGVSEGVASYQGFARSFAVPAIILLTLSRRVSAQAMLVLASVLTLYLLGARSEFYGFLFVLLIAGWLVMLRSHWAGTMMFFSVFVLFIILFLTIQGSEYSNRQLEVLQLSKSSAIYARTHLLSRGWEFIKSSPIVGDYAGQMREGGFGSYIHNGLSAWRQFGLAGFSLYFGLAIFSLYFPIKKIVFQGDNTAEWRMALYMNSYVFLLMIAAKSVFDMMAPFAWGLSASALNKHLNMQKHTLQSS
ncbi:MAG: hypothetical protein R6U40_05670 [Desulfobacterales bacterium]